MNKALLEAGALDTIDEKYLPETGALFELQTHWVDRREVEVHGAWPGLTHRNRVLFFTHPAAAPYYRRWLRQAEPGPTFTASATSSTRTVFAWRNRQTLCLKLTLPVLFAGDRREVTHESAANAVKLSQRLGSLRTGLRILKEPFAVTPRNGLGGYLVRELPKKPLTPWFTLKNPQHHFAPFLKAWRTSAIEHGWVTEAHSQNLLLGSDGRYWVRDLDSVSLENETEALRHSLHSHFLGGPAYGHRRAFLRALEQHAGKAAHDPGAFAEWVEDRRHETRRAAPVPARVRRWLKREQTENDRARDPALFAPVDLSVLPERFRPEHRPVWRLPYVDVPDARIYGVLPRELKGERGVRIFFHPSMASAYSLDTLHYGAGKDVYWASPTASPRSVVVWNTRGDLFGLKLSLDVELLRINRLVEDSKLRRAVAVSATLKNVRALREPCAVATDEKPYGFIFRELPAGLNRLEPAFSKFARGAPIEHLLAPLVNAFAELAFAQGLIGDFHQQNVLFDRGEVVLRDLDSFRTDPTTRALRGLPTPFGMKLDERYAHEAWAKQLRGEWGWLICRTLPRARHAAVWQRLDALLFAALERHLGKAIVDAERAHVLSRWPALYDRREPSAPLYSVDAMLKAWKAAQAFSTRSK